VTVPGKSKDFESYFAAFPAGPKGNLKFPHDGPLPLPLISRIVRLEVKPDLARALPGRRNAKRSDSRHRLPQLRHAARRRPAFSVPCGQPDLLGLQGRARGHTEPDRDSHRRTAILVMLARFGAPGSVP
jgi:hypothetical protein